MIRYIELHVPLDITKELIKISKVADCLEIKYNVTFVYTNDFYCVSENKEVSKVICLKHNCKLINYSIEDSSSGKYLIKLELEEI